MNILLVGNGFDIANGLPTKYNDFLDVCDGFLNDDFSPNPGNATFVNFSNTVNFRNSQIFHQLINNSVWVYHFRYMRNKLGDKWGDFETEIQDFIEGVYQKMKSTNNGVVSIDDYIHISYPLRFNFGKRNFTYKMFINFLYKDLKRLTKALDLYFNCYIENIKISPKEMPFPSDINKLLSFNYTSTYISNYYHGALYDIEWCNIHGKTGSTELTEDSSLVLGFDDHYLEKGQAILEIVPFEKYYQRLINRTDNKYLIWLNEIADIEKNNLYIYGHSLAPSDGDILKAFIDNNNVNTTVYYYNEEDRAEKVANLAVVLGPDELIRLAGGIEPKVKFVQL